MRFLILGVNYVPESAGIGPYTAELAEHLVERGHTVDVVTALPHYPQWKVQEDYRKRGFISERINGVSVHRTYAFVPSKPNGILNRVLYDTAFGISAFLRGWRAPDCDLVIALSPPLQTAYAGWLLSRLRRVPLFFHIKDIVSRAAIGAGMVGDSSPVARIAHRMEKFAYEKSDAIGVICPAFKEHVLASGIPESKIVFFPDHIDTKQFQPSDRIGTFRARHNIDGDKFVVMYSGGLAQKHAADTLITAASKLAGDPDLAFVVIGEGPAKKDLQKLIQQDQIKNLVLLPFQPREELAAQLSAADVLVITQKKEVTDAVFPGKLLAYMASQRPIVVSAAAGSETGRFVNQHAVGLVVPPEDPDALAGAILRLKQDPGLARQFGFNARNIIENQFEKERVLNRVAKILEQLARAGTFAAGEDALLDSTTE